MHIEVFFTNKLYPKNGKMKVVTLLWLKMVNTDELWEVIFNIVILGKIIIKQKTVNHTQTGAHISATTVLIANPY